MSNIAGTAVWNVTPSTNWRELCDSARWHPAASLFPVLSEAELEELAEDIRRHGLLYPVVMHEGQGIDGRNRLLACGKAEAEPWFVEWARRARQLHPNFPPFLD